MLLYLVVSRASQYAELKPKLANTPFENKSQFQGEIDYYKHGAGNPDGCPPQHCLWGNCEIVSDRI